MIYKNIQLISQWIECSNSYHKRTFIFQINSRSLRLGANRRKEVVEEYKQASETVLQLLVC